MRSLRVLLLALVASPVAAADLELPDFHCQPVNVASSRPGHFTVLAFLSVDCPVANLYIPRLAELHHDYHSRGVRLVGIMPHGHDSADRVRSLAERSAVPFPLLLDHDHKAARQFGATRTPEVVVVDVDGAVRYRGRIDDQFTPTVRRAASTRHDLKAALDELLAGQSVTIAETSATGCLIDLKGDAVETDITYCRDVAPIIQKHCQHCHRPGQIAPFSLTGFADARSWGATIKEVVSEGRMPPWHANPHVGQFANDPTLSATERKTIIDWVDGGRIEGDPRDLPAPRAFADNWGIPTPDVVIPIPEPFPVPAEGIIEYQYIEVDPHYTQDRWVRAAEVRPGVRSVVHHCNVFVVPPNWKDNPEDERGWQCFALITPGMPPMNLPAGMAKRVPAGWRYLFVLHYTADGTPRSDQTSLGLVFANPAHVRYEVLTSLTTIPDLAIPPRTPNFTIARPLTLNEDVKLIALYPHMHYRGKSMKFEAEYPDGRREMLLDVPNYDFHWQHRYELATPKPLPAGTTIHITAVYDNSTGNPSNPDPDVTVRTGKQSWDEMFNAYVEVVRTHDDRMLHPTPIFATLGGASTVLGFLFVWGRRAVA
ncbi:MAG: redoxin domain-containing protein [Gemmataceae bacterium]|nr:redoxin domain-containing protein [Gemmataceae bacterium]